jgi:hypothetical protein
VGRRRKRTVGDVLRGLSAGGGAVDPQRFDERTAAMNATIDRIDRRVSVAEERQAAQSARGYGQ